MTTESIVQAGQSAFCARDILHPGSSNHEPALIISGRLQNKPLGVIHGRAEGFPTTRAVGKPDHPENALSPPEIQREATIVMWGEIAP